MVHFVWIDLHTGNRVFSEGIYTGRVAVWSRSGAQSTYANVSIVATICVAGATGSCQGVVAELGCGLCKLVDLLDRWVLRGEGVYWDVGWLAIKFLAIF